MKTAEIIRLFNEKGHSEYGGEPVTQLEHALQAAQLAVEGQAGPALVAAALLHDVGHLLHDLPDDAPDRGVDDHHETSGFRFLESVYGEAVAEPVRLHVAAKRFLCAVDPEYLGRLSEPSLVSLRLQGGPMSEDEQREFRTNPFADDAVRLRKWDDEAKVTGLTTAPIEHYESMLSALESPRVS